MPRAITRFLIYFLLVLAGVVLFAVVSMLQKVTVQGYGAYYYSDFLRNNYTLTTGILFLLRDRLLVFFCASTPGWPALHWLRLCLLSVSTKHGFIKTAIILFCSNWSFTFSFRCQPLQAYTWAGTLPAAGTRLNKNQPNKCQCLNTGYPL